MRGPVLSAWPLSPQQAALQLPLLALPSTASYATLPLLYEHYRAAVPPDNLVPLLGLLLAKRVTLYVCALDSRFYGRSPVTAYVCVRHFRPTLAT